MEALLIAQTSQLKHSKNEMLSLPSFRTSVKATPGSNRQVESRDSGSISSAWLRRSTISFLCSELRRRAFVLSNSGNAIGVKRIE